MPFIESHRIFEPTTDGVPPFVSVYLDGPWRISAFFGTDNPERALQFQAEVHALAADMDALVALLPPPASQVNTPEEDAAMDALPGPAAEA